MLIGMKLIERGYFKIKQPIVSAKRKIKQSKKHNHLKVILLTLTFAVKNPRSVLTRALNILLSA